MISDEEFAERRTNTSERIARPEAVKTVACQVKNEAFGLSAENLFVIESVLTL